MKKNIPAIILLFLFSFSYRLYTDPVSFSNLLPQIETGQDSVTIKVAPVKKNQVLFIHYKTQGLQHFQIRKMKRSSDGKLYYQLSTANLYGKKIEYCIVEKGADTQGTISPMFTINNFTDQSSPEVYFMDAGTVGNTQQPPREPIVKLGASLSSTTRIHDSSEYPGESFTLTSNMRLFRNIYKENYQFDFESNFTYMNKVSENEKRLNLTSLLVKYKRGIHELSLGDLNVYSNNTLAMSGVNKRGVNYTMQGKNLYLSSFFANSQQKTGFDGFGLPPADAYIFGAMAGFNIGPQYSEIFQIRGLFLSGKDNLDSKTTVYYSDDPYKEGTMMSLWGKINLFKTKLSFSGEYARSDYGKGEDSESIEKSKDKAWRAGTDINLGPLSGSAAYMKVGNEFNSIADPFLQNDRQGLTSNLNFRLNTGFSMMASYNDTKEYVDDPVMQTLHKKVLQTSIDWLIANHLKIGAGYGLDNTRYDEESGVSGGADMDNVNYTGSIGYVSGSNSLTLSFTKNEAKTFRSNINPSLDIRLQFGDFKINNLRLSYQKNDNFESDSFSKIYNGYLEMEIVFIPEIWSMIMTGSFDKTDNSDYDDTQRIMGKLSMNLDFSKFFNSKFRPVLSLWAQYVESKNGDLRSDSVAVYLQADVSF